MKFTRPRNIPLYAVAMASVGIVFFAACLIYTQVKERPLLSLSENEHTQVLQQNVTPTSSDRPSMSTQIPDSLGNTAPPATPEIAQTHDMTQEEARTQAQLIMKDIDEAVAEAKRIQREEIDPLLADWEEQEASYQPDEIDHYIMSRIEAGATLDELNNDPTIADIIAKKYGGRTNAEWEAIFKQWDAEHAQWDAERETRASGDL